MESMQFALDNVVSVIYDGSTDYNNSDPEMQVSLGRIFEGMPLIFFLFFWVQYIYSVYFIVFEYKL